MERHSDFYNELKQTNSDLLAYVEECHKKSPYFDFSPTFQDYTEKIRQLEEKFPIQNNSSTTQPAANLNSNLNSNSLNLASTNKFNSTNSSQFSLGAAFSSAPSALSATSNSLTTTTAAPTIFGASTTPFSSTFTNSGSLFSAPSNAPLFSAQPPAVAPATTTTTTFTSPTSTATTSSSMPFGATSTTGLFSFGSSANAATATTTTTAPPFNFSFKMPEKETTPAASTTPGETKGDQPEEADEADDQPPPEPKIDRFEEQNVKHSARCKLYEKAAKTQDNEVQVNLLGVGYLYVKDMDQPNKFQVIFRQEPDLRRVLLNEVVTPIIPIKPLPKAVQMVFPGSDSNSKSKFIIAKLRDDKEAKTLYDILNANR